MKLYFVRHGESEANVLREVSNRGYRHPLTALGRQQAAELARSLARVGVTALHTSPLMRAVETASILAETLGATFTVTDALREYDCGDLEGRSDEAAWRGHAQVQAEWLDHGFLDARSPGGESFNDMRARFIPFIEALVDQHGSSDATVVLVGHGGLYRCMLPQVLTNLDAAFAGMHPQFPNTGAVIARATRAGLVCTDWCGEVLDARIG